jgi:nucleobase:cation symporter-1, NCS1 family
MSTAPSPDLAEQQHALDPVPEEQRESTAMYQFWIWAGANIAPINWVLGALGIVLGLSLADTVLVLVVGNLIGMAVFGFFVLMGQRTGVSQMVLTRSAFGRRGAYLPAIIQGVTSAGWCAINTWIVLDLVVALLGQLGIEGGVGMKIAIVAVVMALQTWIAANGFRWIAAFEKYTVPVTLAVLLVMTVVAWTKLDVDWGYDGAGLTGAARLSAMSTVMTAIGIGWGITWLAYASDYSRFVPRSVPARKLYAASVLGQFIPVVWLGVLGASVATIGQQADPGKLIVAVFGALAIPVLLLVLHGPIATNILNIYSCALCALTVDLKISRRTMAYLVGVFAFAFTIVLIYQESFAHALDGWLASLVVWAPRGRRSWRCTSTSCAGSASTSRRCTTRRDALASATCGGTRWLRSSSASPPPGSSSSASRRCSRAPAPRCWATSTCPGWPASSSPGGCTRCSAPDAGSRPRQQCRGSSRRQPGRSDGPCHAPTAPLP